MSFAGHPLLLIWSSDGLTLLPHQIPHSRTAVHPRGLCRHSETSLPRLGLLFILLLHGQHHFLFLFHDRFSSSIFRFVFFLLLARPLPFHPLFEPFLARVGPLEARRLVQREALEIEPLRSSLSHPVCRPTTPSRPVSSCPRIHPIRWLTLVRLSPHTLTPGPRLRPNLNR